MMTELHRPLTTGEIAQYCHVTHRAVLKWVATGKLKAYRTPGKHSRVSVDDFKEFLQKYDMPIPQEIIQATQRKKKILIVDDDKTMVKVIRRALAILDEEFEVEEAFDGFTAGLKFKEFMPDLITLDVRMPQMDGYDVCSQLRSDPKNNQVKILAISGFLGQEEIKKILQLGADDYLVKPMDNNEFALKIMKLLKLK